MSSNVSLKNRVGILIPTMNRANFIVRLLNYYANLNSPHTIYIADSSNEENAKIIKKEINKLKDKLSISYLFTPSGDSVRSIIESLLVIQEKYVTFIGDDDYFVPSTLTACAEFLENNFDYHTAMGLSLTIRVAGGEVYGKLTGIHDYPRYSIEANTASQRLLDYLGPCFTTITAAVLSTECMLKYFQDGQQIKDISIKAELLPCCRMIIAGKSKILDQIGCVRQIHNAHFHLDDMFDHFTNPNWNPSYQEFRHQIVQNLVNKDNISVEEAEKVFKKAFWFNFQKYLSAGYHNFVSEKKIIVSSYGNLRTKIGSKLPILKKIYRAVKQLFSNKYQLHYEVMQPKSKYYRDFKPIVDSLTQSNEFRN